MKRWARWFTAGGGVVESRRYDDRIVAGAAASAHARNPLGSKTYSPLARALGHQRNDAETEVDLGAAEGGVCMSEITVDRHGGTAGDHRTSMT
jgi:hypothetical protein